MSTKSQPSSWLRLLSRSFQNPPRAQPSFSRKICTNILPNTHYSTHIPKTPIKPHFSFCRKNSTFSYFHNNRTPKSPLSFTRWHFSRDFRFDEPGEDDILADVYAEMEREKKQEREDRKRKGLDTKDIDEEDKEDYMGVTPLIEKLEKKYLKEKDTTKKIRKKFEWSSDSDSESEDEEDLVKLEKQFERKKKMHEQLLKNYCEAVTLDDAFKWMDKIDKFEEKHFKLSPEYRVIGDLMNLLKVAEGKEKFILQQKLNRAVRLLQWRERYDPNNPANYKVMNNQQVGPPVDHEEEAEEENQKKIVRKDDEDEEEEEFDDMKEKDNILLEKLNAIDKKLEEKLAELDYTFGRKGKLLEEEIRYLAEERNSLTEKKRRPLYRKGFDLRLIDINRTCKVTKGGQVVKYTVLMVCGNYHGVVGYAKAKADAVPIAVQRAHEKCFQNLHYIERHEEHTIAHAIQASYKKTKVYLWPAPTASGMRAGRTVENILLLAGFNNIKSKVIGSRNPHNTVKAVFKALNAVETPKDMQEKFGRAVVEKHLLQ
ncbi:Pentatricopeptide repeat-containing protein, putative isoform 1 [Hibiscus syriacus]|uniref:Pentatricopeptide repeat-containing protein, putative isoform 1 n=1 Tax=Hibiscus syriacus TaxID=106335 RepID=A0A6A3D1N8_HIBSY|nr:uncharacterized protein LOC120123430 [Hibiscus syriacus]KAE8733688.1 Pentatricopeptide repeat-containing protein, putative isoform 1 [Hibiscus syriacus]